jgi:uncharacterized protein YdbL (DUF1318 family)
MKRLLQAFAMAAMASSAVAQSPQVLAAIETGQVGERYDGYMGFASPPSEQLRRQVLAVNIQRRNLYTGLAVQRNVNVQLVGIATACVLFRELPVGEAYMLEDKVWRHRELGQPFPSSKYCR